VALEQYKTQVLLLHSEQDTLEKLSAGFNDQYSVHLATSGSEALNIFTETPVHVIVSAQDLPGMSGLDALREAKKRSPETIGILLAGNDPDDGLEALAGDQEVFQIVRGQVTPQALCTLIESTTKRARLVTLSESANDTVANVDHPADADTAMETARSDFRKFGDISGTMPAMQAQQISDSAKVASNSIDLLVLTKDEEFLATIKNSSRGMHNVHHCVTPAQTKEIVQSRNIGVLVTDAAMVGSKIGLLTKHLRQDIPRLVAVVAGRRDDGDLLMDLINRGEVYRFLLKPVSPGRARLAIEAAVNHHMDAPDKAFKAASSQPRKMAAPPEPQSGTTSSHSVRSRANAVAKARSEASPPANKTTSVNKSVSKSAPKAPIVVSRNDSLLNDGFEDVFGDDNSLTQTMPGLAALLSQKITDLKETISPGSGARQAEPTKSAAEASDTTGESGQKWKIPAIAATVIVAVAGGAWFALNSDEQTTAIPIDSPVLLPTVVESDIAPFTATTSADVELAGASGLLADARDAVAAGRLVSPPADNAVELYVAALAQAPDDSAISSELGTVVEQVFSMAESAILDRDFENAAQAIRVLQITSPENPRLAFLTSQLSQQRVRSLLDDSRLAIRDGRIEDAAAAILEASIVSGTVTEELQAVSDELAAARSAQEIDEVLALANSRLERDQVIQPANDNARYYYELALSNDPDNIAARQGLKLVAGKLVLLARDAIGEGHLTDAGDLLGIARSLDATSRELAAATTALMSAEAQAEADAIDEADRLAEQERTANEQTAAKAAILGLAATAAATGNAAGKSPDLQSGRTANTIASPGFSEPPVGEGVADAEVTSPELSDTGNANPEADNNVQGPAESGLPDVGGETIVAASTAFVALNNTPGAPGIDPGAQATPDAVDNRSGEAAKLAKPAEPEMVPISSLTRINYVAPKYPRSAQRRSITGSVDVGFTVTSNGKVTNVSVLASSPGKIFNDAAMEAVAAWRFEPAIENGQRIERKTAVRLAFALQ